MGKKKDKSSKSKKHKKSKSEPVAEPVAEPVYEDTQYVESESENIQIAEYVTVGEMMDLINTLNTELEQRAEAGQQLQKQITRNQNTLQGQYNILRIIAIILVIGVIAVGYNTVKISSRMNEHVDTISADLSRMTSQIQTVNTSMQSMNSEINRINTGLNQMSADITTVQQNIDKLTSDVNKINVNTTSKTNEPRYRGYPTDPRSPWR